MTLKNELKEEISNIEKVTDIQFPKSYISFLETIPQGEVYEIQDTGICLYSFSDLIERNETYEIRKYDPNYFMIGQDGDMGYFINANDNNDNSIYSLDLGAVGSLPMKKEASDIQSFIAEALTINH